MKTTSSGNVPLDADFAGDNLNSMEVGMQVEHQRFGLGKVIRIEGKFPDNKATVNFNGEGHKQLLLKYAKLKIIRS